MAGRGRGRSLFTFNVDSLGFGRGDTLPASAHAPSPLYPVRPMQFQPVPLQTGEEVDYMLALKQELRASSKNLPFHIRPAQAKKDVDRYSDKYQTGETKNNAIEWVPDWSRFPKELCIRVQKPHKRKAKPLVKHKKTPSAGQEEFIEKLKTLEKKEAENHNEEEEEEVEKKKETGEDEEEHEEGEDYDEEELEDETDYIISYFDNGEDFGGDSDDNMDEATY